MPIGTNWGHQISSGCSEGATIVMLPAIGKSHFLVFERLAEVLTDRGYEV